MEQIINRLTLKTLLLAEITRLKFGSKMSLTNPKIEKIARVNFAEKVGIKPNSKPNTFIAAIGRVYIENKLQQDFDSCLQKFGLNPSEFI